MFLLAPPSIFQKHDKQLCSHRAPTVYKCWPALPSDPLMFIICRLNMWLSRRAVAAMQHELQTLLKFYAANGDDSWFLTFPPRVPLSEHQLHLFVLKTSTCVDTLLSPSSHWSCAVNSQKQRTSITGVMRRIWKKT